MKNILYPPYLIAGGLLSLATTQAFSDDPQPPTPADCEQIHANNVSSCNDSFNDDVNSPEYDNQEALEACLDGANAALQSCLGGNWPNDDDRTDFLDGIKACLDAYSDPNDSTALEYCLLGKLNVYRFKLGLPLIDSQNNCGPTAQGAAAVAPIDTVRSAAIELGFTDGKYPVQVESTLSFQAGVSVSNNYNMSSQPCIKRASLFASFQTKLGPKTIMYDADTDTSDGVFFDLPVFANKLVDASNIDIFILYYDENGGPSFIEYTTLSITDSPLTGDWNRDQVFNTQDVVDFLASYDAQTKRADINGDTQVTPADVVEFVNP